MYLKIKWFYLLISAIPQNRPLFDQWRSPTPQWLCEEANMTDLSEKYRPTCFDEVRGQELAVEWRRNQIRTNKGQSVLFSGPIGVGKTSLALILREGAIL
jgi:DNA replication protein DnaC